MNKTGIYAIIDILAQEIQGPLVQHKHEATAIRFFVDVAQMADSIIAKHIDDFVLVRLGWLINDDNAPTNNYIITIEPDKQVILSGKAWKAAQTPRLVEEN